MQTTQTATSTLKALIAKGTSLVGGDYPQEIALLADESAYVEWRLQSKVFLTDLLSDSHIYAREIAGLSTEPYRRQVSVGLGILKAVLDDVENKRLERYVNAGAAASEY